MKPILYFISATIFFTTNVLAQDSLDARFSQEKVGIGFDVAGVTAGPHAMIYHNRWLFTGTFGLPQSRVSDNVIRQHRGTILVRAGYSIGSIYGERVFWPIYLGAGYTNVFEKSPVAGYAGNGSISGLSFFLGFRMLEHNTDFLSRVGSFIEAGFTNWQYSNSILTKNSANVKYNYSSFFFSIGACYYL